MAVLISGPLACGSPTAQEETPCGYTGQSSRGGLSSRKVTKFSEIIVSVMFLKHPSFVRLLLQQTYWSTDRVQSADGAYLQISDEIDNC